MNTLEAALVDLAGFLDQAHVPYMVIGGFANLRWGRPRLTQDLDITIQIPDASVPAFVERLGKRYRLLSTAPLDLARDTRVIPIATAAGVRVDLILAGLPYEEEAIRRAVPGAVTGTTVRFCTAEDLILHKLVSERPRDLEDVEGVVIRQGAALDRAYLDPLVDQIAAAVARPGVGAFYKSCLEKAGIGGRDHG